MDEDTFEFSDEKDPVIYPVTNLVLKADVKKVYVTWKDEQNKRFLGYVVKKFRLDGNAFSLKSEAKFPPDIRSCCFENMSEEKKFRVEVAAYTKNKYRRVMYGDYVRSNVVRIKSDLPEGWTSLHSKSGRWFVNMFTHEKTKKKPDSSSVYYVTNDIAVKFQNEERFKLLERFKQFDTDNDGSLGVAEMNTVLDDLGVKFTRRKLMKVIDIIDRDRSGTIEFGEYLLMIWMLRTGKLMFDKRGPWQILKDSVGTLKQNAKYTYIHVMERMTSVVRDLQSELDYVMTKHCENEEDLNLWKSAVAENTGQIYYYNTETNESQWHMPSCVRFYMPPCLQDYFRTREIKMMRKCFKIYDKDGNGKIYLTDVRTCLADMNMIFTDARVTFLLKSLKLETEDQISFRYFAAVVFGIRRGRVSFPRMILAGLGCDMSVTKMFSSATKKVSPVEDEEEEEEEEEEEKKTEEKKEEETAIVLYD